MTDRPILFSAPMVRALLDGRKTQTRRILNPQPFVNGFHYSAELGDILCHNDYLPPAALLRRFGKGPNSYVASDLEDGAEGMSGYYVGDRLYVRETWRTLQKVDCLKPKLLMDDVDKIDYRADGYPRNPLWAWGKNRVAIHMPRWASRLTLTVTDVRVQRLQDCSEEDAIAEGVPTEMEGEVGHEIYCPTCQGMGVHGALGQNLGVIEVDCADCQTAVQRYRNLWDHINGAGAWEANPWVVAVSFDVERRNIDAPGERDGGRG